MIKEESLAWAYQGYSAERDLEALDRNTFVGGAGNPAPRLVIVGEAPGRHEAETGIPFSGPAGALLSGTLRETGTGQDDCWFTNVVKFRPTGLDGRDRPPADKEIAVSACPYLWRELEVIGCKVICALGLTAFRALGGSPSAPMALVHGTWRIIHDPAGVRYALFVSYHPAAALRNPAVATWLRQDLGKLAEQVEAYGTQAAEQLA